MTAPVSRIGIVGGMGPLAGVELHRLIVTRTSAEVDQDHLQVVLYTDPRIPDRTRSLLTGETDELVDAVRRSIRVLERAGADVIALACMTVHAWLDAIRASANVPVLDGVELTRRAVRALAPGRPAALLATTGSVAGDVFGARGWTLPDDDAQNQLQEAIYEIKAGRVGVGTWLTRDVVARLAVRGAGVFVLGCTELSLLHDELASPGRVLVDPLRILADHLVSLAGNRVPVGPAQLTERLR